MYTAQQAMGSVLVVIMIKPLPRAKSVLTDDQDFELSTQQSIGAQHWR